MIARKDDFHDSLTNVFRKLEEKEIVVTAGYLNGHIGSNPENYERQHGGSGYGVRKKQGEKILEFCAAMNVTVGNTLSKNRESHLVIYESGPSKT